MRIALIHAMKHSIAPTEDAFRRLWPDVSLINLLDELAVRGPGARRLFVAGDD